MSPSQFNIGSAFFHTIRSSWGKKNGYFPFDDTLLRLKIVFDEWSVSPFGLRFKIHMLPDYHTGICQYINLEERKKDLPNYKSPFTGNLIIDIEQRHDEVIRAADRLHQWVTKIKKQIKEEGKKVRPSFSIDETRKTVAVVNDFSKKLGHMSPFKKTKLVRYTLPLIIFHDLHWHRLPYFYIPLQN
jgi:hypothetical protein